MNADVCEFTTKLLTLRYCTWPWSLKPLPRGAQKPWVQHERTKHERRHESMSNDSKFLKQISCTLNCSDEFSHESFCVVCVHRWVLIISWLSKLHIILDMWNIRSAIFHCFRKPMVSCKVSPVLLWLALLSAFVPSACTSRSSYLFIAILLGAPFFV